MVLNNFNDMDLLGIKRYTIGQKNHLLIIGTNFNFKIYVSYERN